MPRAKLKPCPWCGQEPQLETVGPLPKYYYSCNNLKCSATPSTNAYRDKKSATRAWNKRYTKDIEVAVAKKIFADLEGKIVTNVTYHGEVIWESAININDLKKKYGVLK